MIVTRPDFARFDRCPKAMLVHELREEADLIADVQLFREHGLAPRPGGLHDQDPRWVDAVATVGTELAGLTREKVGHVG